MKFQFYPPGSSGNLHLLRAWHGTMLASVLALTVLAAGCGGGADVTEVDPGVNTPVLRQAVDDYGYSSVPKVALSMTDSFGEFGTILKERGWSISRVTDPSSIPSDVSSILYVNADDPGLSESALKGVLERFRGVLILDSRMKRGVQPVLAQGDTSVDTQDVVSGLYNRMTGRTAQAGTGLFASMQTGSAFSFDVDEQGKVNGYSRANETGIDPRGAVLQAQMDSNAMKSVDGSPSAHIKAATNSGSDICSNFYALPVQRGVLIDKSQDGWNITANFFIRTVRDGSNAQDGPYKAQVGVCTATTEAKCSVNNKPCGVTTDSQLSLMRITDKTTAEDLYIQSPPIQYRAYTNTNKGYVQQYMPTKESWYPDDLSLLDAEEKTYTTGWSVGSGLGWLKFSPSFAYSSTIGVMKRTNSWEGVGSTSPSGTSGSYAESGINSKFSMMRGYMHIGGWFDAAAVEAKKKQLTSKPVTMPKTPILWDRMADYMLNGKWSYCSTYDDGGNCFRKWGFPGKIAGNDGTVRSALALAGFSPNLVTTYKLNQSAIDNGEPVTITAGIKIDLPIWHLKPTTNLDCSELSYNKRSMWNGYVVQLNNGDTSTDDNCSGNNRVGKEHATINTIDIRVIFNAPFSASEPYASLRKQDWPTN